MGRRKKELPSAHRSHIADAAQILFQEKGIDAASMDDIAKAAGYSKATLYVYFKNKEEIVSVLTLESMQKLYTYLSSALQEQETSRGKYDLICKKLTEYQAEYPFYFKTVLDKINVDFENTTFFPEEEETYHVGEHINEMLYAFFQSGIEKGDFRADLPILSTIFSFWGMLSGVIQMSADKEDYFSSDLNFSRAEFLSYSFDLLYHSISAKEL